MIVFRLVLPVCFAILCFRKNTQAQTPDTQLIGRKVEDRGLYTYAWSEPVDVMQVMPIIAANGTPTQQRRARRLLRLYTFTSALGGMGIIGGASGGFFGEPQLKTRQTITIAGSGLALLSVLGASIHDRRARRLVESYNDTVLTETDGYVRTYTGNPYLTLADTVALSGNRFSYRGLDGVLPTRTTVFDWKRAKPRFGVAGSTALGLTAVGALTLAVTSVVALQPGDYRRLAWSGAGLTVLPMGLAIPVGIQNRRRQVDAIRRYNQFVRDRGRQ